MMIMRLTWMYSKNRKKTWSSEKITQEWFTAACGIVDAHYWEVLHQDEVTVQYFQFFSDNLA